MDAQEASDWLFVLGMLSGPVGLGSLVLAIITVWLLRWTLHVPARRAIALSFAAQVAVMLVVPTLLRWLNPANADDSVRFATEQDTATRLRFAAFVFVPIAVSHLLLLPFFRKV